VFEQIGKEFDDQEELFEHLLGIPPYGDPKRPDHAERARLISTLPVELIHHCSGDYPMYFLAVRGTKQEARRGSPTQVFPQGMFISGYAHRRFLQWCEEHGITVTGAGWHIMSYWG
jgi:hypothetical protein